MARLYKSTTKGEHDNTIIHFVKDDEYGCNLAQTMNEMNIDSVPNLQDLFDGKIKNEDDKLFKIIKNATGSGVYVLILPKNNIFFHYTQ